MSYVYTPNPNQKKAAATSPATFVYKDPITTLIPDMYDYISGKGQFEGIKEEDLAELSGILTTTVVERFKERRENDETFKLRMSNYGQPNRRLWYEANCRDEKEPMEPHSFLNFLIGDIWEGVILFLAKKAGHKVESEQETVEIEGVVGHMDAIIDGVMIDVKSASKWSFENKFEGGKIFDGEDSFGYIPQLKGYAHAVGKAREGWLAANKENGRICLTMIPEYIKFDAPARMREAKEVIKLPEPPAEKCYEPIPMGKGGNMQLNSNCKFCVDPKTPILMADLTWKTAQHVKVGDSIIGFNEEVPDGKRRRFYEVGTVTAAPVYYIPTVTVWTEQAPIAVSQDHKFLATPKGSTRPKWIEAKDLKAGDRIRYMKPWIRQNSYEEGWMAGILDGEGCYSNGTLSVAQNSGLVQDKIIAFLDKFNFSNYRKLTNSRFDCSSFRLSCFDDVFRMLGMTQSVRLTDKFLKDLPNRATAVRGVGDRGFAEVIGVSERGLNDVIGLETSCKTYIANGFFSHNCPFKAKCWADANDGQGLRAFKYASGVVYLSHVESTPNVQEINLYQTEEDYED